MSFLLLNTERYKLVESERKNAGGWAGGEVGATESWRPEVASICVFQAVTILIRLSFTVKQNTGNIYFLRHHSTYCK